VVEGAAPVALEGLATPDAVFVGGGATDGGVLDAAMTALRAGGRLVVNAVTLETEAELLARHAACGGDLIRLAVARAEAIGGMRAWRPARPITQWVWVKP
jgi:precorrin-6B C5,15-methyltransferase / cobalt-precorrin-6B C5,C15-methyltransferase